MTDHISSKSFRIVIAEDNRAQRLFLKQVLEQLGHTVLCAAANGEQLQRECACLEFDLAILDLDMPVMDGLAAAEELWSKRQIPVILVSGHPDLEFVNGLAEPVACCLCKPISMTALEQAIASAVKK